MFIKHFSNVSNKNLIYILVLNSLKHFSKILFLYQLFIKIRLALLTFFNISYLIKFFSKFPLSQNYPNSLKKNSFLEITSKI